MRVEDSNLSQGLIDLLADLKETFDTFSQLTIDEKRSTLSSMYPLKSKQIDVNKVEDQIVEIDNLSIPIRVYVNSPKKNIPILVYFHGGGWVLGDLNAQDRFCRLVATTYECVVISVDYRLAPENKFPAAIEDATTILKWLQQNKNGWDWSRIITAGDSAGGNISAVVSKLHNKAFPNNRILHQIMIYPVTDLTNFDRTSYLEYAKGYALDRDEMEWYAEQYLPNLEIAKDPRVSPLLDIEFNGYSPTTLFIAGCDVLHDEAIAFGSKLMESNIDVTLFDFENMMHSFLRFFDFDPNANKCINEIVDRIGQIWNHSS